MARKPKPKPLTRADLLRKIEELEALQAGRLHFAELKLDGSSIDKNMGSAIIVRLHTLGGSEITPTFAIRDGLSEETINALRNDIVRSYELATMLKPRMTQKDRDKRAVLTVLKQQGPSDAQTIKLHAGEFNNLSLVLQELRDELKIASTATNDGIIYELRGAPDDQ